MGYIYLASPYTGTTEQREQRFIAVCKAAAELMQLGTVIYSPIAHGHVIEQHMGGIQSHAFWMDQCLAMLRRADRLLVLCLPGWKDSKGVALEIEFAKNNNIPCVFIETSL